MSAHVRSVLVVDDHAGFRAGARLVLEQGPFRVVGEAADGATGLQEVARLRPDIVLLDIALPDIDGFEVTHRLLARLAADHDPGPSVILVSSRDARDYGGRVERSGARGFIQKARLSSALVESMAG